MNFELPWKCAIIYIYTTVMLQEIEKQYRFDLVVINRVFQFFADSVEECQLWVNVLHVAISKFKPQEHEHKEGGSMHNPDKQGYLQKQGHGAFSSKSFKERYENA